MEVADYTAELTAVPSFIPGTYGSSQPYSDSYHVVPGALAMDKKDPDIYDPKTGYFKNPKAVKIQDAIHNERILVDGTRQDGSLTYVMDSKGNIIIAKRFNPNDARKRAPHPTLIGGKDPMVQCAGMIRFRKGRILYVNVNSGHFRPNRQSLKKDKDALRKICDKHPDLFDQNSEWRKK